MEFYYWFWLFGYISATFILLYLFIIELNKWFQSPSSIDGKHVLITGGSSGIGKCMGIEAVKLGADVTIIARDSLKLETAANDIQKHCLKPSQKVNYVSLDVSTNYQNVEKVLNNIEQNYGPVYMLVSCAGTAICGTFEDMTIENTYKLINLNYLGVVHTIKALITKMKARNEGHIVITSSQAALLGIFGYSVYSSTKFALRGLAETLHMELKPYNMKVTLALPPDTDTPGFAVEELSKPLETKLISESGGLWRPEEVAAQIMKDALNGKFFSTVGLIGYLMRVSCHGFAPSSSFLQTLLESQLLWIARLIAFGCNLQFASIISKCKNDRDQKKIS